MLSLANRIFLLENYQLGPWMHVSSQIRKYGSAKDGDEIRVQKKRNKGNVKERNSLTLDVLIFNGARVVERVRRHLPSGSRAGLAKILRFECQRGCINLAAINLVFFISVEDDFVQGCQVHLHVAECV